jgi:hypothetical protein
MKLVENHHPDLSIPFEFSDHLPIRAGIEVQVDIRLKELAREGSFSYLSWTRNEDDFFLEVPFDVIF